MKRIVFIQVLLCISLLVMAQKECKVLDRQEGSITFEVDKYLPKPERSITLADANVIARLALDEFQIEAKCQNVLATSFADKRLWYRGKKAFYATLTEAFADHRPVKLSPDMLWELICLTFSEYVNNHAEEMRPLLVSHEGVKDLVIKTNLAEDPSLDLLHHPNANWNEVIRLFSKEIEAHTKGDLTQTITADFSTTGMTERIASQVTLMDAVKQYFRFVDFAGTCGIPSITLEGTPTDWRKVMEKTQALEKYNMGWWTKELLPVLQEFVKAAEGMPNRKFWKDIVMRDRPDRCGGGCSGEKPTVFDGWMLKLFPNTKDKTIRKTVSRSESLEQEMSHVGFKYVLYNPVTNEILEEADIELIAGFVGIEVDEATGMLSPKIGWISRKADAEAEAEARKRIAGWQQETPKEAEARAKHKAEEATGDAVTSSAPSTSAGADFKAYVETHKDYWGISLSIPQSMIEKDAEGQMVLWRIFQFSSAEDRNENYPIFYSGPIVNIDKNCMLIMPFLFFEQKPRPAYEAPITEQTVPNHSAMFSGRLLNNCGLPWFHIEHEPSVLNDKELMEKINTTIQKYVQTHADDELTKNTNSDRVFLTQIPYLNKMKSSDDALNLRLRENATYCYGLEFYRADRYHTVDMLLFINGKGGKTIDDYVEQISRYIKFDEDFKY